MKKYIISIFVLIFCVNVFCYSQTINEKENNQKQRCCPPPTGGEYWVVEEHPIFPGGENARRRWIGENIRHLTEKHQDIQGIVFVVFCIEKDGTIFDVEILRGLDDRIDNDVVRIIETMPKWTPAKQRGRPVCIRFNMPIRFNIEYPPVWSPSGIQHETPPRTRNRRQR